MCNFAINTGRGTVVPINFDSKVPIIYNIDSKLFEVQQNQALSSQHLLSTYWMLGFVLDPLHINSLNPYYNLKNIYCPYQPILQTMRLG